LSKSVQLNEGQTESFTLEKVGFSAQQTSVQKIFTCIQGGPKWSHCASRCKNAYI